MKAIFIILYFLVVAIIQLLALFFWATVTLSSSSDLIISLKILTIVQFLLLIALLLTFFFIPDFNYKGYIIYSSIFILLLTLILPSFANKIGLNSSAEKRYKKQVYEVKIDSLFELVSNQTDTNTYFDSKKSIELIEFCMSHTEFSSENEIVKRNWEVLEMALENNYIDPNQTFIFLKDEPKLTNPSHIPIFAYYYKTKKPDENMWRPDIRKHLRLLELMKKHGADTLRKDKNGDTINDYINFLKQILAEPH